MKRGNSRKRKSRKARLAMARALVPARAVAATVKLAEEIGDVDDESDVDPIMCPFDEVVAEVDGREPLEYAYRKDKLMEYGIGDVEA